MPSSRWSRGAQRPGRGCTVCLFTEWERVGSCTRSLTGITDSGQFMCLVHTAHTPAPLWINRRWWVWRKVQRARSVLASVITADCMSAEPVAEALLQPGALPTCVLRVICAVCQVSPVVEFSRRHRWVIPHNGRHIGSKGAPLFYLWAPWERSARGTKCKQGRLICLLTKVSGRAEGSVRMFL